MPDRCKPVQTSIETAFEAEPPSSPVQPDASKWKLLAVSLLYTENTDGEPRDPLLTVRRVSDLLGVTAATVYARCHDGTLRHMRVGSAIRIASSDLEAFVLERTKLRASGGGGRRLLLPPGRGEGAFASTVIEVGADSPASGAGQARPEQEER
jgi:excisionase family DNA binding protein